MTLSFLASRQSAVDTRSPDLRKMHEHDHFLSAGRFLEKTDQNAHASVAGPRKDLAVWQGLSALSFRGLTFALRFRLEPSFNPAAACLLFEIGQLDWS
jgi:hypothetical protein